MFDISGTGSRAKPMYAEDLYAAGQNMFADQMAPGIKRMTGYESPKRKAMAIAGKANLNSMSSIQDTHKQLQQINAEMANAWLKQSLESYNSRTQRMTAENSRLSAMSKAPAKRETKFNQVTGQLQYVDNGQVVPGFEAVKSATDSSNKPSDLPQMSAISKENIENLVDEVFDFGFFDLSGKKTDISKNTIVDFVFSHSQIKNIPPEEVIRGLADGTIKLTDKVGEVAPLVSPKTSSGFQATPAIPK